MHILSPVTDNCPSWISGRERMAVEIISWPISTKDCRQTWGLSPWLSAYQADAHPTELPRPALPVICTMEFVSETETLLQWDVNVLVEFYLRTEWWLLMCWNWPVRMHSSGYNVFLVFKWTASSEFEFWTGILYGQGEITPMIINFEFQQNGWFDSEVLTSVSWSFMTFDLHFKHFW